MHPRMLVVPLLTCVIAITGCSHRPMPDWVARGSWAYPADRGRALYAVGISSEKDPQLRNDLAKANGRTELARRMRTHVEEVVKDAIVKREDLFDARQAEQVHLYSRVAEHTTAALLGGSHKFDEWIDTRGEHGPKGTLYVLMVIVQDDAFYKTAIEETRKLVARQQGKLLKTDLEAAITALEEEIRGAMQRSAGVTSGGGAAGE